jgi:hypothetical protein
MKIDRRLRGMPPAENAGVINERPVDIKNHRADIEKLILTRRAWRRNQLTVIGMGVIFMKRSREFRKLRQLCRLLCLRSASGAAVCG